MALTSADLNKLISGGGLQGIPGSFSDFNEMGPNIPPSINEPKPLTNLDDLMGIPGGGSGFNEMGPSPDDVFRTMSSPGEIQTMTGTGPSTGTEPTFPAPNRSTESFMSSFSNIRNLLGIPRPQNRPIGSVIENQLLNPESSPGFQLGQNLLVGRQKTRQENLSERLRKSGIGFSGPALQMSDMIEREGDIDIGNLGLAAGQQGVQNALTFEPQVQGNFRNELLLAMQGSENSKTREMLRDIARQGNQADIGGLIATLLGQGGGGGITGLINLLKQGGGAVGSAGKAIFDWLTGSGINPLTASESQLISALSRLNEEDLAGDALGFLGGGEGGGSIQDFLDSITGGGESLDDIFGDTIGSDPLAFGSGPGGGGGGGMGAPPTPPGVLQELSDALGIGGGAATTAATFPAFLSQVDAALAAAGLAPFTGQPAMASALAAAFPEFAASLGVEGAAAGAGAAGAAGAGAGAGGGSGFIGAGAGAAFGPALTFAGGLALIGALVGLMPRGQSDFPQDLEVMKAANRDLENQMASGQPLDQERLSTAGWGIRGPNGENIVDYIKTIIANPVSIQTINGQYVVPIQTQRASLPTDRGGGPIPSGPWFTSRIGINLEGYPGSSNVGHGDLLLERDPRSGSFRIGRGHLSDPRERERDRRSEMRSISRQD